MRTATACLVLLVAAACLMAWFAVYQVDDAFIVYRYAHNLAHGLGFVFNPGERVEGVTCFLWTALLAPFDAVGLPLPSVAPVLTGLCGLLTLIVVARHHAECEGRTALVPADLLPSLLLAAHPAFAYWSVGALETVPFTLLLVLAVRDHAREVATAVPRTRRSASWLALAALVRPEAPLIALVLAIHRLATARARGDVRGGFRDAGLWLARIGALFVPFLLARRWYFGDWLPNTSYAKLGGLVTTRLSVGWHYAQTFAGAQIPILPAASALTIVAGLSALLLVAAFALSRREVRADGLVVLALGAAVVWEGGDWMVLHRFFVPALPLLAVIVAVALRSLASRGRLAAVGAGALVVALLAHDARVAIMERNGGQGLRVNAEGYRTAHLVIADYVAGHSQPGDSVALMDVGMIGWHLPRLRVIDITGLTDRDIARAPGGFLDKRYPVSALLVRRPRFVILVPGFPIDSRILADPAFRGGYRFLFAINHRANWNPPSEYDLSLFERNPE